MFSLAKSEEISEFSEACLEDFAMSVSNKPEDAVLLIMNLATGIMNNIDEGKARVLCEHLRVSLKHLPEMLFTGEEYEH